MNIKIWTRSMILISLSTLAGCETPSAPNTSANNLNVGSNVSTPVKPSPSATSAPDNTFTGEPKPSVSPLQPDAKGVQDAIDVVHEYYNAINARNYRKAYKLWSGEGKASGQSFEEFGSGFENTASVEIDTSGEPGDLEGAAGSQYMTIPLLIKAKTKDGKEQNFWGQYVLRRSMVDGATPEQRSWRIYSAEIRKQ